MKTDRLFQILYILLEKQVVTAPELAERLEVSVRTIYRDVDALSVSGIPVYTLPGKNGGISLMPGYTFDKSLLSDKEQEEVLFALQSMKAAGQEVSPLLNKLGAAFQKANRNWIEIDFSRWGFTKTDSVKFDCIKQGILNKRILRLRYSSSYGEETTREVKPVRLIFKSSAWYMQAYCLRAQDFRTFKMNRIISLEPTGEVFSEDFEVLPEIDGGDAPEQPVLNMKLRILPAKAFRAYDEFAFEDIEKQEDGSVIVTSTMPCGEWVYSYILSFGGGMEILEPASLREEIREYLEKIQEQFKT